MNWDPGYAVRWRYAGRTLAAADWSCDGRLTSPGYGEETPAHLELNLQCQGWHVRSVRRRDYFVDPLHHCVWPRGEGYRLNRNVGHAQAATLLFLTREGLETIAADAAGATRAASILLHRPVLFRSDRVTFAHAALRAAPGEDTLALQDCVLALARAVIADACGTPAAARAASPHEIAVVHRGMEYIGAQFRQALSVEDIARAAGVSASRYSTLFPKVVGLAVWRYVLQLRLRAALDAMAEPGASLSAVALELGFSSHSHFTQAFRRHFGRSPSAWLGGCGGRDGGTI
ncbi:helix-turn-helix domain-containing protein [Tahibacter harae]|uniref:AraC family transcriptional regulator n=1 Tax=Tahibacter harae TaxID=2963937 RepID=A0ABT1QVR8_9GAMM|nr:AraC family transcriptional regulator [Tahibacter harae]MCQ4166368.1 AraC family transcriptional regulator [Tahibacter harae]